MASAITTTTATGRGIPDGADMTDRQPSVLAAGVDPSPTPRVSRGRRVLAGACCCLAAASIALGGMLLADMPSVQAQDQAERAADAAHRLDAIRAWWHSIPPERTFPDHLDYTDTAGQRLQLTRIGVAPATDCAAALDPAHAAGVAALGCTQARRAAYADQSQTYLITIAVLAVDAVPGSVARRAYDGSAAGTSASAGAASPRTGAAGPAGAATAGGAVVPVAFPDSVAAALTPAAGVVSYRARTDTYPFVVWATTAFADGRTGAFTGTGEGAPAGVVLLTVSAADQLAAQIGATADRAAR